MMSTGTMHDLRVKYLAWANEMPDEEYIADYLVMTRENSVNSVGSVKNR